MQPTHGKTLFQQQKKSKMLLAAFHWWFVEKGIKRKMRGGKNDMGKHDAQGGNEGEQMEKQRE